MVGKMTLTIDNEEHEVALIVKESIEKVGFFKQIILYITSLF